MSECKAYRREIEEAADGRPVSARTRAHAALCRVCGDELRDGASLRALVGGLGKVGAPADFEFRLRARMAASKIDRGHGRFSGTRWLYGLAPVAVAACFVVVSATLYFRQESRPTTTAGPVVASAPAPNVEPARTSSTDKQNRVAGPEMKVEEVAGVDAEGAASLKIKKPVHRVNVRAAQSRAVASNVVRRAEVETNTLVTSVTGARVIHLPLKSSAEPLRVILRDDRGAERVVPMRSVSFGSQSFLARDAATRPSAAVEVGGVW